MTRELYYVTGNAGKFKEVAEFIKTTGYQDIVLKQVDLDLEEIQTLDQKGIAIRKAQQAWKHLKKPLVVDDSGIYLEQYHRFPGTLTRYVYEGIGWKGVLKLAEGDHRATFLLYLIYIQGPDMYHVFEGSCAGKIIPPQEFIAHPSLPWDDLFVPNGSEKTYAQMYGTEEFTQYAYRLLAFQKFLSWFEKS